MKHTFTTGFAGMKGGVFTCDMCGKRTRDTGENGSVNLCPKCYKECMDENSKSDGFMIEDDIIEHVQKFGKYVDGIGYTVEWNGKLYTSKSTRKLVLQICKDENIRVY